MRETRREWMLIAVSVVSAACLNEPPIRATTAPAAPVAIARCKTYDAGELRPSLERLFDRIGGLGRPREGSQ